MSFIAPRRTKLERDRCLHDLFAEQAERNPDATALILDDQQLSYGELDVRANQLAHHLRSLGVGPEKLVGVYVDRSLNMIVSLLGVMKAGGAYVPIDPSYPRDRIAFMMADSGADVLLTQEQFAYDVPDSSMIVVRIDSDWEQIRSLPASQVETSVNAANLAYVIYTSGSTGKPKGVAVTHQSAVHLFDCTKPVFDFTDQDTWTVSHSFAFDLSVWEIFGALTSGARLVIIPQQVSQSPSEFYEVLRRHQVTVLSLTPPALRQLCELEEMSDAERKLPALRLIVAGGDVFPGELSSRLLKWGVPLWNFYGPTESTVWATIKQVCSTDAAFASVPIGQALPDLSTYILNERLDNLEIGVTGELCLGGAGLARGYFRRADLTAEKFIPDPFSKVPGARLYKTGDLARSLANADLEHLGRVDHQVKVRGFRIELGEIEAVLSAHQGISEAVVMARDNADGEKRLVAYLVPVSSDDGEVSLESQSQDKHTSEWQDIWEETYTSPPTHEDPTFNITGWNDSYTGLPYPAEEVRDWVSHTVENILALRPKRVLEIGCGTGLLLFRIAPHCEEYVATDPSANAVNSIERYLKMPGHELPQVQLAQRMGHDFAGLEDHVFDVVVLNSVIQYFPNAEYLEQVIAGAVKQLRPGGSIFVGDIRSYSLLKAFHASIQLHLAPDSFETEKLREQSQKQLARDEQLGVDPGFFWALKKRIPNITDVRVQLKRGHFQNETVRFRYDVVIEVDGDSPVQSNFPWHDWQVDKLSQTTLQDLIVDQRPAVLGIRNIPNSRVVRDVRIADLMESDDAPATAGELREELERLETKEPVNPEDLVDLAHSVGYTIQTFWSDSRADCFNVILQNLNERLDAAPVHFSQQSYQPDKPSGQYANNPLRRFARINLLEELRAQIDTKLPDYMRPGAFVFLDAFPLTHNGKVDRNALPAPDQQRPDLAQPFVAPRTSAERKLAEIWTAVLKLDRVGMLDNFFELGGHSLIATQMITRVQESFGVRLSLRMIFESPTIAQLTVVLASQESNDAGRIPRRDPDASIPIPLSFSQERLWFLDNLVPGTTVYNIPVAIRIESAINIAALEQALNEIVRRHESLRTRILVVDGQPFQEIAEQLELSLPIVDLQALPESERASEQERLIAANASTRFDLSRAPLMRASLLHTGDQQYVLLLCLHHIVTDNWGMAIFFDELSALYTTFATGNGSLPNDPPIQYADYALWQRKNLEGESLSKHLSYWDKQLASAPTVLELPFDYQRPEVISLRGDRHTLRLQPSLVEDLRGFSRREGVTTFMTLLAVFNVLLNRYTGQDDILVGSPIANRNQKETEDLIGLFLNNLVLRTKIDNTSSFSDLLHRVRETVLEAYAHQDVPFEQLVRRLQLQRDLSRTPLFQVFFNMFDVRDHQIPLSGTRAQVFSPMAVASQFDVTLYAGEERDTIELTLVYNSDIFAPERMAGTLHQFRDLLEQVVAAPDQKLGALSLLTAETLSLLPDPSLPLAEPYYEPVTRRILENTNVSDPAVCQGAETWTYGLLQQTVKSLSQLLLSDGFQKGDVVALTGPPSFNLIAGLVTALSSGGVLLTVDQALPIERQQLMLREAKAKWLLAIGPHPFVNNLPDELSALRVVRLEENGISRHEHRSDGTQLPAIDPTDPAYIFFTSGTSGKPKAVVGSHKGLSHFIKWQSDTFAITPTDRCAQITGLSFDVVLRDILLPLYSGASLHLPPDSNVITSPGLLEWLRSEEITVLHTVPSLAKLWLSQDDGIKVESLRYAFFAGEPLTDTLVHAWRNVFPSSQPVNLYGPSETTLAKCFYVVPDRPCFGVQPVGRPLPNSQALVLNGADNLCGINEPGEIVIRTPFRTLGYLNPTARDADRFVPNPFAKNALDQLYRTGDRGRFKPDGALDILGRFDDQVKIRGVRVEPDEVNAVLSRNRAVATSVVIALKNETGENALAAYVVSAAKEPASVMDLRKHLEQQLPSAFVPSYFVMLEQMPLTANGKVDRRALPAPDFSFMNLRPVFVAPQTATELLIAGVWSEVLSVESVGIQDNFFELGGHSLKAMQVLSRLNSIFNIELPLPALFVHTTVEALAGVVEDHLVAQLELLPEAEVKQQLG
jgi:amino acid adenylation domain-containing protein